VNICIIGYVKRESIHNPGIDGDHPANQDNDRIRPFSFFNEFNGVSQPGSVFEDATLDAREITGPNAIVDLCPFTGLKCYTGNFLWIFVFDFAC